MYRKSSVVISTLILVLISIPTSFAQYDPEGLFEFSKEWQRPVNETNLDFNFDPGPLIDEEDLLLLIEGWHSVPDISFVALPSGGPAPLQVEFRYGDPLSEPQIEAWAWDLDGDSIVDSTASNPSFLYQTPGDYTVTLTVETVSGQTVRRQEADFVSVREPVETIVADGVIVVDNEPCLSFVSKTETTLVLEQSCIPDRPVVVGVIVVGSEEGGYARRVLSITESGTQMTLQTENVALTELFNSADISGLVVFTPEDLQKAGFKIGADGKARKPFDNVELHAGITVSGGLEFDPALDWDCQLGWDGVDYLRCVFVGTLSMDYKTTIGIEGGLHLAQKEVSLAKLNKWAWYQIGYVPVIIYTEFDIKAGIDAGIEGDLGLSAGYSSATTVRFGAEYDRDAAEPWSPVTGLSLNTNRFGPEFDFNAGGYAKVYLKPEAKLRIYGILGPGAAVEPYLRGDLQFTPPQELKLTAGIDAELGFSIVDLSCIGIDFDIGYTGRFNGPVVVLGNWPLTQPSGNPAVPAFDAAPTTGIAPLTVQFTDRSDPGDGTITSWSWDLGDGRRSTTQHPSHVYQSPGTYRAELRVEGTSGSADWSASEMIAVQPPPAPPAVESFSVNQGAVSTDTRIVTLNSACTGDPTELRASENSNFSGASWQGYAPSTSFVLSSGSGTKRVYFKVKNVDGESSTVSDTIQFSPIVTTPVLTVLPGSLNFGSSETRLIFQIANSGDGTLSWRVTESESWLGCESSQGDTGGDGTYSGTGDENVTVIVGRMGLADGTYTGDVSVTSNGGSETVQVSMRIGDSGGPTITINLGDGVTMDMVLIPAGSFMMGSNDDSSWSWCYPCEQPVHPVTIDYDFYMGKTEITQAQWEAVMGSWPYHDPADYSYGHGDNYPAYYISWNDCQNFISALNQLGQGTFRLPSEAEWEYACRAGTTTRFYFGDSDGCGTSCEDCAAGVMPGNRSDYMWYCGNNGSYESADYGSKEVEQLEPNDFGLFDMHGNVWEWCEDDWHDDYTYAPDNGAAWVDSPRGSLRVVRGGSWGGGAQDCRSAYRCRGDPDSRHLGVGFRLVRTP